MRKQITHRSQRSAGRNISALHPPVRRSVSGSSLRLSSERGIALILTLAIVTLVTLILIGFTVSMRVENTASKSFNDVVKARELAQGAIDQAVGQIRQATPIRQTGSAPSYYVTYPGVIFTNNNGASGPVYLYPLYPGYPSVPTDVINSTNLNAGFWITGYNGPAANDFASEPNSQLTVGWLYVAQDGTIGPSPLVGHGALIGRFTYWVDDEASKININTAWTRGAGNSGVVPDAFSSANAAYSVNTEVDLSMLLPGLNNFVNAIQGRQSPSGPGFTTTEEVKLAEGATAVDSDFETNRFYLTTYSDDSYYPTYDPTKSDLDVFERPRLVTSALTSPGDIDGSGGRNTAYGRLTDDALKTVYSSSGTFVDKYTKPGLEQIIANIIAYQQDPTNQVPPDGVGYLGLEKTPYINEVKVQYDVDAGNNLTRTVSVELFYLYGLDGVSSFANATEQILVTGLPTLGVLPPTVTITPTVGDLFNNGTPYHSYADISPLVPVTPPIDPLTPTILVTYRRAAGRLDFAQMTMLSSTPIATAPGTRWQGAEVDDPCVNDTDSSWVKYTDPTGSKPKAGSLNSANTVYAPPEAPPSKARMRGAPMLSIGELGFIHRPQPWKYLTLQPGGGGGPIPDWAALDLFSVPGVKSAGRININSYIWPGFASATVRRTVPLKALLNIPGAQAAAVDDIYDDLTVRMDTYGMQGPNGPREGVFDTIGEICEIPSLIPSGATTQADKEKVIRRIANIITVRSSAFTIWAMAQSIKQPPGATFGTFTPGTDLITGEVRAQAVVERYENPVGNAPQFRVRYFRYL